MHKPGAAANASARTGARTKCFVTIPWQFANPLIYISFFGLHNLRAMQRKHAVSRAYACNPRDINKVIHRKSGFLKNPSKNQALADETGESAENQAQPLAQIRGVFPS
jgi:hypothetical protein